MKEVLIPSELIEILRWREHPTAAGVPVTPPGEDGTPVLLRVPLIESQSEVPVHRFDEGHGYIVPLIESHSDMFGIHKFIEPTVISPRLITSGGRPPLIGSDGKIVKNSFVSDFLDEHEYIGSRFIRAPFQSSQSEVFTPEFERPPSEWDGEGNYFPLLITSKSEVFELPTYGETLPIFGPMIESQSQVNPDIAFATPVQMFVYYDKNQVVGSTSIVFVPTIIVPKKLQSPLIYSVSEVITDKHVPLSGYPRFDEYTGIRQVSMWSYKSNMFGPGEDDGLRVIDGLAIQVPMIETGSEVIWQDGFPEMVENVGGANAPVRLYWWRATGSIASGTGIYKLYVPDETTPEFVYAGSAANEGVSVRKPVAFNPNLVDRNIAYIHNTGSNLLVRRVNKDGTDPLTVYTPSQVSLHPGGGLTMSDDYVFFGFNGITGIGRVAIGGSALQTSYQSGAQSHWAVAYNSLTNRVYVSAPGEAIKHLAHPSINDPQTIYTDASLFTDIALDEENSYVYVVDEGRTQILRIAATTLNQTHVDATVIKTLGFTPNYIAQANGMLYVGDKNSSDIWRMTVDGSGLEKVPGIDEADTSDAVHGIAVEIIDTSPVSIEPTVIESSSEVLAPSFTDELDPVVASSPTYWFEADQIDGVADGAQVETWNDASGNGWDAPRIEGSPLLRAAGLGGQPAVEFFASEKFQTTTITGWEDQFTMLIILRVDDPTRTQTALWASNTTSSFDVRQSLRIESEKSVVRWGNDTTAEIVVDGDVAAATDYLVLARKKSGQPLEMFVDGVEVSLTDNDTTSPDGNNRPVILGSVATSGGSSKLDGHMAAAIGWQRALTDDEIRDINNHRNAKYGSQWTDIP